MCSNRYKEKGVKGCGSKHIYEEVLQKVFVEVFNTLLEHKQHFLEQWQTELDDANELKRYRLKELVGILEQEGKQEQFSDELCLKMLGQIEVLGDKLVITLLDEAKLECKL